MPSHPFGSPATSATPVPVDLRGAWRRASIEFEDGTRDDTSIVVWIQLESRMADVRFTAAQQRGAQRASFDACSDQELSELAKNESSTGYTVCSTPTSTGADGYRATAEWFCYGDGAVAFQPTSPYPEPGELEWCAGSHVLVERAPSGAYVEEWHRVEGSQVDFGCACRPDGSEIFWAGPLSILVHDRRMLPEAHALDCEFSLAEHGLVIASTVPDRLGHDLST